MLEQDAVERAAAEAVRSRVGWRAMVVHPSGRTGWTISYTSLIRPVRGGDGSGGVRHYRGGRPTADPGEAPLTDQVRPAQRLL